MARETTSPPMLARVRKIETKRLFGLYDHTVVLNLEDRVTIVHGANGVGKTVLLRLINALFSQDYLSLLSVPYDHLLVTLVDGSQMRVTPTRTSPVEVDKDEEVQLIPGVQISVLNPNGHEVTSFAVRTDQFSFHQWALRFAQRSAYLSPMGQERFYDQRTETTYSAAEVWRLYGSESEQLPMTVSPPPDFNAYISSVRTHLVEAQRLMRLTPTKARRYERSDASVFTPAVMVDAQEIASRLRDAFAQYGRISQKLDQTFPQRLFAWRQVLSIDDVKKMLGSIEDEQARLATLGVLEAQPAFQLPLTQLESTKFDAMELFVTDNNEKLQPLLEFASRVEPLLSNINAKFKNKEIRLDKERGLVARAADGAEMRPDHLSSGEQHEIVMLFHLLFRVSRNTLVLIDEPELSLHIDWQRRFLPELLEIAARTGIDALVATHSPSIVGERADLMIDLESSQLSN